MSERNIAVPPEAAGERLDKWLSGTLGEEMSRSRIQALIRSGDVLVDGRSLKAHASVRPGWVVTVKLSEPVPVPGLLAEDIPLTVLHEDDDIIVIDKPAGLVVHPGAGNRTGTLVNALLHRCGSLPGIGGEQRPGIVHRLDKGTSGVMVAAKSERAMIHLARQFRERKVLKEYCALVWGQLRPAQGRIETMLGRNRRNRKKMSASATSGRSASTVYETVETFERMSLVKVRIETGRTHQIRVHMSFKGCPVVGDSTYGRSRARVQGMPPLPGRPMLHAAKIAFKHPVSLARMEFSADLPADMAGLLLALRKAGGETPRRRVRCGSGWKRPNRAVVMVPGE